MLRYVCLLYACLLGSGCALIPPHADTVSTNALRLLNDRATFKHEVTSSEFPDQEGGVVDSPVYYSCTTGARYAGEQ